MTVLTGVAAAILLVWLGLALADGRFWTTRVTLPRADPPLSWPAVVAVVPARDEAAVLPTTLPTLLAQRYPGRFAVVVVDDDSSDGSGDIAAAAGATVVRTSGPPAGWSGKVAAMAAGVRAAPPSEFILFTDADIAHPPDGVARLVSAALAHDLVLTSQMVRLRTATFWERLLVPAFVWFFAQLYPFRRVNSRGRTAAAAGGCMLARRDVLGDADALTVIRSAVIDDVALGRVMKRHGRIWLGLGTETRSVRGYPGLSDLWDMIARSAYTQLRHSPGLLAATVVGLLFTYAGPPATVVVAACTGDAAALALGLAAEALMLLTYVPMLRWYGIPLWHAVLLPAVAVLYAAMTVDSARRHRAGRGAAWKGRISPGRPG